MMKDAHPKTAEAGISRRGLGQWALGSVAALVLGACGGGGGGGDGSSSQSGRSLRPAHDAVEAGMGRQDVVNTVGRLPDEDVPEAMTWRQDGELLMVTFGSIGGRNFFIAGSLWVAPSPSSERHSRQLV